MYLLYYSLYPAIFTLIVIFFFFNDTATTEIYTLSLHDALPISHGLPSRRRRRPRPGGPGSGSARASPESPGRTRRSGRAARDRKSTRLNSSHANISYAVFCLKKKKKSIPHIITQRFIIRLN